MLTSDTYVKGAPAHVSCSIPGTVRNGCGSFAKPPSWSSSWPYQTDTNSAYYWVYLYFILVQILKGIVCTSKLSLTHINLIMDFWFEFNGSFLLRKLIRHMVNGMGHSENEKINYYLLPWVNYPILVSYYLFHFRFLSHLQLLSYSREYLPIS